MYLNMGEVPTPFHMLKVKVTTDKQRVENCDESILKQKEPSLPPPVLTVDGDEAEESQHNKVRTRVLLQLSELFSICVVERGR